MFYDELNEELELIGNNNVIIINASPFTVLAPKIK